MPDIVDQQTRSRMMAGIGGKNTKPEMTIRRGLHALGYRFRLHAAELPGKPDIVLKRYRAAIFVNGCFWHRHDCHLFRLPGTRTEFWRDKIARNVKRDRAVQSSLIEHGWRQMVVWECALKGKTRLEPEAVMKRLTDWLVSGDTLAEISGAA